MTPSLGVPTGSDLARLASQSRTESNSGNRSQPTRQVVERRPVDQVRRFEQPGDVPAAAAAPHEAAEEGDHQVGEDGARIGLGKFSQDGEI